MRVSVQHALYRRTSPLAMPAVEEFRSNLDKYPWHQPLGPQSGGLPELPRLLNDYRVDMIAFHPIGHIPNLFIIPQGNAAQRPVCTIMKFA